VRSVANLCRQLDEVILPIASDRAVALTASPQDMAVLARTIRQAGPPASQALDEIVQLLALDLATFDADDITQVNLRHLLGRLEAIAAAIDRYGEWAQLNHLRSRIETTGLVCSRVGWILGRWTDRAR
jgi:hypothetical protein